MTISYKWLCEYLSTGESGLPLVIEPERLSRILTSIGLEVEMMKKYEEAKGGLKGLVIGEVMSVEKHPNADKLTLTRVDIGNGEPLQIVCGAPNVAAGQKVVVAPVGVTIYPANGDPLTMKVARISSVESYGMICAEDEIGLGKSHDGILVLPDGVKPGTSATEYFKPAEDWIYEIGLTPNRMESMSHWGVARDVCAYLNHHDKKGARTKFPMTNNLKRDNKTLPIQVKVENTDACPRYSGVSISGVTIGESPAWLKQRLKAIGQRPINNLVDITNFIQHETGQPLHAFDADHISGGRIIVKNLPDGASFVTLDEKERKLSSEDLMICDEKGGLCIAGVLGGLHSGVTTTTRSIFLESACFDPVSIRKTSFRHNLRTDAATRFEKGTDISATVTVLRRAATLIKEICGGEIASDVVDVYPNPRGKTQVILKNHYLKKLSGKNYHPDTVREILVSLGYEVVKEGIDELRVAVPYHKPDVEQGADLVEEIMRIDGLDNIAIPESISITPATDINHTYDTLKEKISRYLAGLGFNEMLTNSITNSAYFSEDELKSAVAMMNNLSAELNILRPSMLETGLESVAYNLNRKNNDLKLFEFGRTYKTTGKGQYEEPEHLCLYLTGRMWEGSWRSGDTQVDIYYVKGVVTRLVESIGLTVESFKAVEDDNMEICLAAFIDDKEILRAGRVGQPILERLEIKQAIFYADLDWDHLVKLAEKISPVYRQIPRYPVVHRDLSVLVPSSMTYGELEKTVLELQLKSLTEVRLFDVFESEKLGPSRKSMALSFTFLDEQKTLTDEEIDGWMNQIMASLESGLQAEVRK